jgi:hypothetical protein
MYTAVSPEQAAEIHNLLGMVEVKFAGAGHSSGIMGSQLTLPWIPIDQADHMPARTSVKTHLTIEATPNLGFSLYVGTIFFQTDQRGKRVAGLEQVQLRGLECSLTRPTDALLLLGGSKTELSAPEAGSVVISTLIDCLQADFSFNPSPLGTF